MVTCKVIRGMMSCGDICVDMYGDRDVDMNGDKEGET